MCSYTTASPYPSREENFPLWRLRNEERARENHCHRAFSLHHALHESEIMNGNKYDNEFLLLTTHSSASRLDGCLIACDKLSCRELWHRWEIDCRGLSKQQPVQELIQFESMSQFVCRQTADQILPKFQPTKALKISLRSTDRTMQSTLHNINTSSNPLSCLLSPSRSGSNFTPSPLTLSTGYHFSSFNCAMKKKVSSHLNPCLFNF